MHREYSVSKTACMKALSARASRAKLRGAQSGGGEERQLRGSLRRQRKAMRYKALAWLMAENQRWLAGGLHAFGNASVAWR